MVEYLSEDQWDDRVKLLLGDAEYLAFRNLVLGIDRAKAILRQLNP